MAATARAPPVPRMDIYRHLALGRVLVVAPACLLFLNTHSATPRSDSVKNSDKSVPGETGKRVGLSSPFSSRW